jgi:hypothetical protein
LNNYISKHFWKFIFQKFLNFSQLDRSLLQWDYFQEISEFLTTRFLTHYNEIIFKKFLNSSQPGKSLIIFHHQVGHPLHWSYFLEIYVFLSIKQVIHYNEIIFKKYLTFLPSDRSSITMTVFLRNLLFSHFRDRSRITTRLF